MPPSPALHLTANGGAAARVAGVVYAERRFDELPVLADALEEAGCRDADVLGHCRGPGPHARGCWVVGLILGEQRRRRPRHSCSPPHATPPRQRRPARWAP
jgi:hypothetical protein